MASSARGSNSAHFSGVRVFSATMPVERDRLGEKITEWIAQCPDVEVVDTIVTQSSDQAFHCLAITVFYVQRKPRPAGGQRARARSRTTAAAEAKTRR